MTGTRTDIPAELPVVPPSSVASVTGVAVDGEVALPHACEAPAHTVTTTLPRRRPRTERIRVPGIDLARALAVLGMMIVHVTPMVNDDGMKTAAWVVTAGNSAALFAVLAGVGVGLTTGRNHPPRGRAWVGAALNLIVRTLFIGMLGLIMGFFIPASSAEIILPTYAVLFLMMIPFLRGSPRVDMTFGILVAIGAPLLSHVVRSTWNLPGSVVPIEDAINLTLLDPIINPRDTIIQLVLTGAFPALTWFGYALFGLGLGRTALWQRHVAAKLLAGGVAMAGVTAFVAWFLMDGLGGREELAAVASRSMELNDFTDLLVWGSGGTLPTTTWWWNAVLAPHTGTPLDLMFTLGIACAVLGACLIIGRVVPGVIHPLVALGSMPLTAYIGHLWMLTMPFLPHDSWTTLFIQFAILIVFALVWRAWFSKGPLEAILGIFTGAIKAWSGPYRPARAIR